MRPQLKLAAVLALLAACGDGPTDPGAFTLEGSWLGRAFPYELALELEQDGDNNVTGEGEVRSLREDVDIDTLTLDPFVTDTTRDTVVVNRVAVDASGEWGYQDFVLTLRAADYADVTYAGRFGTTSPDSVGGSLQGSGFGANTTMPLVRQGN
ncbi:MAG TPA: hypothetical protein VF142_16560 [Longimicrobium sp.]